MGPRCEEVRELHVDTTKLRQSDFLPIKLKPCLILDHEKLVDDVTSVLLQALLVSWVPGHDARLEDLRLGVDGQHLVEVVVYLLNHVADHVGVLHRFLHFLKHELVPGTFILNFLEVFPLSLEEFHVGLLADPHAVDFLPKLLCFLFHQGSEAAAISLVLESQVLTQQFEVVDVFAQLVLADLVHVAVVDEARDAVFVHVHQLRHVRDFLGVRVQILLHVILDLDDELAAVLDDIPHSPLVGLPLQDQRVLLVQHLRQLLKVRDAFVVFKVGHDDWLKDLLKQFAETCLDFECEDTGQD